MPSNELVELNQVAATADSITSKTRQKRLLHKPFCNTPGSVRGFLLLQQNRWT